MPLVYFIAGMLFIYFIIPFTESLLSLIVTSLGKIETQQAAKTYKIKQSLTAEEETKKAVIGFTYQEEEEEE